MHTQGTIETTNNNGGTKRLALIKSRLLWLYLSTVITRNSVMRIFFSFASNRFPVLTLTAFHGARGIYKLDSAASVFWEGFQFLYKSPETVTLGRSNTGTVWKICM